VKIDLPMKDGSIREIDAWSPAPGMLAHFNPDPDDRRETLPYYVLTHEPSMLSMTPSWFDYTMETEEDVRLVAARLSAITDWSGLRVPPSSRIIRWLFWRSGRRYRSVIRRAGEVLRQAVRDLEDLHFSDFEGPR